MSEQQDDQFISAEDQGSNMEEKLSFRLLALQQLQRIMQLSSKELRAGYWKEETKIMNGISITSRVWIESSLAAWSNAIDALHDLCFPHFDDVMLADMTRLDEQEAAVRQELTEKFSKIEHGKSEIKNVQQYELEYAQRTHRPLLKCIGAFLKRKSYFTTERYEQ